MSGIDLMASVAGPYAGPEPPHLPTRAPVPLPTAAPDTTTIAPAAPAAAAPSTASAATSGAPAQWWSVEHHSTDGERHVYCGPCYAKIPDFLIRQSTQLPGPGDLEGKHVRCEGCGTSPDLTGDTLEALAAFVGHVQSGDAHPAKDTLGDALTIACLEHARDCVLLCAAARGLEV